MPAYLSYDRRKPLFSLHLPKCGGNSVASLLESFFGDRFHRHYYDEMHAKKPPRCTLGPDSCVHGHFDARRGVSVRDYYPEADQFITFVRDPFEARVSSYFFIRRLAREKSYFDQGRPAIPELKSLEKFLLAGVDGSYDPSAWSPQLPMELTLADFRQKMESSFVYIGVVEDMDRSADVMAHRLGYEPVPGRHQNKTERDEEVDGSLRELFIRSHPLEYAIYEYALERYSALPPLRSALRPPRKRDIPEVPQEPLVPEVSAPVLTVPRIMMELLDLLKQEDLDIADPKMEENTLTGQPYLVAAVIRDTVEVAVMLSPWSKSSPCFRRTKLFDIGFQAEELDADQIPLMELLVRRIRDWENISSRSHLDEMRAAWPKTSKTD